VHHNLLDVFSTQAIVRDYAERCTGFLQEATKWAPQTTRSHLQEYLHNRGFDALKHHSGLAMASECLLKFAGLNLLSESLPDGTLDKRPESTKTNLPKILSSLSLRCRYMGQIEGMLSLESIETIIYRLVNTVSESVPGRPDVEAPTLEEFLDALWTLTALVVHTKGTQGNKISIDLDF